MTVAEADKQRRLDAAQTAIDRMIMLAQDGVSVVSAVMGDTAEPGEWTHYPPRDARDTATGYRFFYHCHRDMPAAWGEHGHFHLFVRAGAADADKREPLTHLVALSVDARGLPLRVFTTNRWVTDEIWRPAPDVLDALDGFRVAPTTSELLAVADWLAAMTVLFRPQIERVIKARDQRLTDLASRGPRPNLLDDRRLHVLTSEPVSLEDSVAALDI
ncbi:DUF6969 family protein [Spectribacter hydrogenooxidans]|uniref:DUF6969 domain-containing protein n=1 Tax=Spectribacter hydrogenoxidans TaxID=3075608 RepID=A0ABU3BXU4_9GAMM|nr:hypothetical protein [Salinisphaera sp. W335]MDT0634075.1 hypothetical protein [Salinisphaera sp. W335]